MSNITEIQLRHQRYLDSMVSAFEEHLRQIVSRAQAALISELQRKLAMTADVIDRTPGNMRLMRTLDTRFIDLMNEAGYQRLVNAFVGEFPGQLPFLEDTLNYLSDNLEEPLPRVTFTTDDKRVFAAFQENSKTAIESAVEAVSSTAMQRGLFSVGGLKFGDLVASLVEKFETTVARAKTLADTSITTYYRTATDRAFQVIEAARPDGLPQTKYKYSGPDDIKTREFCEDLLVRDGTYTREQIAEMDNNQLPDVLVTCGGWNCRHQWLLDVSGFEQRMKAAA